MTLKNQNFGSEYGIETRWADMEEIPTEWVPANKPGEGFEEYETARQEAIERRKLSKKLSLVDSQQFRVVVYDYAGSKRKNIRILTTISA